MRPSTPQETKSPKSIPGGAFPLDTIPEAIASTEEICSVIKSSETTDSSLSLCKET